MTPKLEDARRKKKTARDSCVQRFLRLLVDGFLISPPPPPPPAPLNMGGQVSPLSPICSADLMSFWRSRNKRGEIV